MKGGRRSVYECATQSLTRPAARNEQGSGIGQRPIVFAGRAE
jgi:hypothetical protein